MPLASVADGNARRSSAFPLPVPALELVPAVEHLARDWRVTWTSSPSDDLAITCVIPDPSCEKKGRCYQERRQCLIREVRLFPGPPPLPGPPPAPTPIGSEIVTWGLMRKTCGAVSRTRLNSSRDKSLIFNDCWRPPRMRGRGIFHRNTGVNPCALCGRAFSPGGPRSHLRERDSKSADVLLTLAIPRRGFFGLKMTAFFGAALRACVFAERLKLLEEARGDNRRIGDCPNRGAASS